MNKKSKKNSLKNVKNLSVKSFLERYYGITNEGISSMTHRVASSFFPQLKRASFEYIQKNPELVSTGKIVLVEDVNHAQAPYFMPEEEFLDISVGCGHREQVVLRIKELFQKMMDENLECLLIVEGEKDLEEDILFQPDLLVEDFLGSDCLKSFIDKASKKEGMILTGDYRLLEYQGLLHGDYCYETMSLPPLERQAVGISRKTDAVGIFYEHGILGISMEGISQSLEDIGQLQKTLLDIFPSEIEEVPEISPVLEEPSYSFKDMPTYELEKLMKVYRASGQMSYYHTVRREIVRRTSASKAHRVEKQKLKMMGMEEGD